MRPNLHVISEARLILLAGLIQFVNILDFMMVMPLGPDFAKPLHIATSDIGLIGGSYTFSAAICGLISALFLDRYARKKAVLVCLVGLAFATFAGALVWNKESMVAARMLAGAFGGPLTSLVMALIVDYVAPERRGRAMGKVAGAFAAASVLGVPFGLEAARLISWHAPFVVTAGLAGIVTLLVFTMLPNRPPLETEMSIKKRALHLWSMLHSPLPLAAYVLMGLTMMGGFMIIPNIAAHLQLNLHYPREQMGILYMCGGAVSFFCMRASGWLVDRYSSSLSASVFTLGLAVSVGAGFIFYPVPVPVVAIFILFMVSMSGRMVAAQTLSSKVPAPHERGAFLSVQSAITHFGSALGAYYSSLVLRESNHHLLNMPTVGFTSICLALLVLVLVVSLEQAIIDRGPAR